MHRDDSTSPCQTPSHLQQKSPSPQGNSLDNGATTVRVFVVFGDLRGWEQQHVRRCETRNLSEIVHIDDGFATVSVGMETVFGPIVYDAIDDESRSIVVYAGRSIPGWVPQRELAAFDWVPYDDLPLGTNVAMEGLDALLLGVDDVGQTSGLTRTIWLPYLPRPMERITIPLGDGHDSPRIRVRVLEVGDDRIVDGETTPFAVLWCDEPLPVSTLQAHGWCVETWVPEKIGAWTGLNELSKRIESHATKFLGFAMATSVTLHHPDGIGEFASTLPLLPADVRTALRAALDALDDERPHLSEAPSAPL
ncbi:MAG: hypothetical protein QG597_3226 [Actinomycetota bacterium]|nr:hypothetical protein [Actinomycetota bacterium]